MGADGVRAPLRIGIDLRRMHKTGIGRYARNIFLAATRVAPEHRYVVVVQNEDDASWVRGQAPDARCVIAPAEQYSLSEMLGPPKLGEPVDVFHSPHPYHLGFGKQHRTVLTLLDLIQITHAIGIRNILAREPLRAITWTACRRADQFVAISETTRSLFHERMGVPLERMHVTPLAPDPHFGLPVDDADVKEARVHWKLEERVVLYVGMTQPHKNLDRLLQAIALLARDRPSAAPQLAIIGPVVPAERARLDERMHALRITDRVRFLGWLSDDEVRLAYHAADVLALPSLAEGFGLTLLEAMRCGTPCVASDLPVLREVAGTAAEFVDPLLPASIAEGLHAVLSDPRRAATLRALGAQNVERFSWENAARATLTAYACAAEQGTRRAREG